MGKKIYLSDLCVQLSEELGAEIIIKGDSVAKLLLRGKNWTIKLNFDIEWSGGSFPNYTTTFTAPFINKSGIRFRIIPHLIPEKLNDFLGFQDMKIGEQNFDKKFLIKGNNEDEIKQLFSNEKIRSLLTQIDKKTLIELKVKDNEGLFGPKYPSNVDLIYYQYFSKEHIKDFEVIKQIFELYEEILNQLYQIESISNENPNIY